MSIENVSRKIWPLPVAVVSALAIFAASFFGYAERHRLNQEGSYLPAVLGIVVFSVAMSVLTVAAIPEERRSVRLVLAVVVGETAVFIYALMFLLLNIYGS